MKPIKEMKDEVPKNASDLTKKMSYLIEIKNHNRVNFIRNMGILHGREIKRGYLMGMILSSVLLLSVFKKVSLIKKFAFGATITHLYGNNYFTKDPFILSVQLIEFSILYSNFMKRI